MIGVGHTILLLHAKGLDHGVRDGANGDLMLSTAFVVDNAVLS
jgi:hypothetical protein